jgi:hypothetical protein
MQPADIGARARQIKTVLVPLHLPSPGDIRAAGEGGIQVAQKVSVTFACDYDEKEIPDGQHLTRSFSLDGRDYEIDLCERHSQKFDEVFNRFATRARKATSRVGHAKRRTSAHRKRSADIRAWAKDDGFSVSDRGRIPADVIARYDASHR